MRTLWLFGLLLASAAASAQDQDRAKFEVFGGYSFEHVAICGNAAGGCGLESGDLASLPRNLNGWNAAVTGYFSDHWGITADFSGHYASQSSGINSVRFSRFDYQFGPTFPLGAAKSDKATGFVHLLFGGVHQSVFNTNGFSAALGGGVDWRVSRHFAVRVAQMDYAFATVPKSSVGSGTGFTNGFRYSGGVVFRLIG
jgi:hypothetical protein